MARRDQVGLYLMVIRDCLSRKFVIVNRDKNLQTLADLNLSPELVRQTIRHLTPENYVRGPQPDIDGRAGEILIFGARVFDVECYIKLKIFEVKGTKYLKCISFHAAEAPLNYPYKKRG